MKSIFILVFILMLTSVHAAPVETFKFENKETEQTFHKLSEELRCLVCQNQSIAESNAGLAKDLRLELYNMLIDGKSEDEIVDFMVKRYGDYVLYRPPFKPLTWLLWLGPILVFFFTIFFVLKSIGENRGKQDETLSEKDLERINRLHNKTDKAVESKQR